MKIFSTLIFALMLMSQLLSAGDGTIHVDGRISAFFPENGLLREIYGSCIPNYEIEIGKTFCEKYEVWGNAGWLSVNGKTETFHTKTRYENANFSLGGKYIFCFNQCLKFYLGLGINAAYARVHNKSHFVKRHVHKNGVGGVVKAGLYYEPMNNLFFELFSDYLYQKIHFKNCHQIGGLKVGGGAGFRF